ncbi:MAG: hypothetical protein MMC33_000776 [Icmadophila ericetorum]|nr:hypothetical protein [Icmadophila ericetorum]
MATTRLVLLTYLESWDGSSLNLNLLLIPRASPLDPLDPAVPKSPSFAAANFKFDIFLQTNLGDLPQPGGTAFTTITSGPVSTAVPVFNALASQFPIDSNPPNVIIRPLGNSVQKHLPLSYQKAVNYAPGGSSLVFTDSTYACALKTPKSNATPPALPTQNPLIPWGKVIAIVLRNQSIARAAGLIRSISVPISPITLLKNGGFVYVTLNPTSDGASLISETGALNTYCSFIPQLTQAKDIFSPVLFPVSTASASQNYDNIFPEVEDYNDGWAKAVHCSQSQQISPFNDTPDGTRPRSELGIRLGWDDEQVTTWMNRQLDSTQAPLDVPLGVAGYRIDTRLTGSTTWHSLNSAAGELAVGNIDLGPFNGELDIETHPNQLDAQITGTFWLPIYFTAWTGRTLVNKDDIAVQLVGGPDPTLGLAVKGVVPDIQLLYGNSYDFRVRLMDHTGGGPTLTGSPIVPGPSPIATIPFQRWVPPQPLTINNPPPAQPDPTNVPKSVSLSRGLLEYPAVVCTGFPNAINALFADLPAAIAANRHPGLPDPDVTQVLITIEVQGLTQDPEATDGTFIPIVITTRNFPSDPSQPLIVPISWTDISDVSGLIEPTSGAILLPTSRLIRIVFNPVCQSKPSYFGAIDVQTGPRCFVTVRKEASNETNLFLPSLPSNTIRGLYMQPEAPVTIASQAAAQLAGTPNQGPTDNATQAAAALGLLNDGLTLRSMHGERVVFGCSASLRHTIGPDLASIRFDTPGELALKWIIAIELTLNRDWTWDGLAMDGIIVTNSNNTVVGQFSPNRNVSDDALNPPNRTQTQLIFFDAVDPKPANGIFPQELNLKYTVTYQFTGTPEADSPVILTLTLPVTTPPTQTPKIISAGIAMSSYQRDPGYTTTTARARALWIELESPVADPNDTYFARVLRYAPDPILATTGLSLPQVPDAPLAIDPEPIRVIRLGQVPDESGLSAMQELIPSDDPSGLFWQLPLPPGLTSDSPELFSFFTYELRVGHAKIWSTAQGRFGRPYQVTGVQHPAPTLLCDVLRTHTAISVSLPYAQPVLNGVSVQPTNPRSTLWVMLYAQAEQLDGQDSRNVLLARQVAVTFGKGNDKLQGTIARFATTAFTATSVQQALSAWGFNSGATLSVLGVEMLPQEAPPGDPLGANLGGQRILRTSPLTPVPHICD